MLSRLILVRYSSQVLHTFRCSTMAQRSALVVSRKLPSTTFRNSLHVISLSLSWVVGLLGTTNTLADEVTDRCRHRPAASHTPRLEQAVVLFWEVPDEQDAFSFLLAFHWERLLVVNHFRISFMSWSYTLTSERSLLPSRMELKIPCFFCSSFTILSSM